jgi:hypothetical protein
MPLRDHFSDKIPQRFRWESFHFMWAGEMVCNLNRGVLPARYRAEPRVRLGSPVVVNEGGREKHPQFCREVPHGAVKSVFAYSPPRPDLTVEADLSPEDVFEVRVYDDIREDPVAAIELISPDKKDCPRSRNDFVVKCASMLKNGVSLVLIDIVTNGPANLFRDLIEYFQIRTSVHLQGSLYCCSLLPHESNGHGKLDIWPEALQVGALLPRLPLWLRDDIAVPLDLESTYEETCHDLRA